MQTQTRTRRAGLLCVFFIVALAMSTLTLVAANAEEHFDTLTIGTQTYTNVTVTTRNKNYVFLLHSAGMVNIKVTELSSEEKQLLGYEPKKPVTNAAVAWAQSTLKKMDTPQVQQIEKKIKAAEPDDLLKMVAPQAGLPMLLLTGAVLLAIYLFGCYCCKLICRKAGSEPGPLVWFPILQMFPLIRAARMSPLWFAAMLLPFLNIIAHIVWCIRIAQARGKSFWTAIFLILPVTSLFAFLYLAFSDGVEATDDPDKPDRIDLLGVSPA